MAPVACPACGETGPVVLRGPLELTIGTVAAVLERRPVVACRTGHELPPAVARTATEQAIERAVARARQRRLRREACVDCGAALLMPVRRTVRPVSIEAPPLPVLTLQLDLPMTRCPDCGRDQVPSRSQADLDAIAGALFADDGCHTGHDAGPARG